MAIAIVMELFVSKVLHVVQYWVTKADGYIQSIQWGAFVCLCYGKLQSHKPAHFHMEREGPGQLCIQLLSIHTGYCGPVWGQYSVMWYVAALSTHLMTKCKIDNDVDSMPQWISGELFVGSGKK